MPNTDLDLRGQRVHVTERGGGAPVLLLHGNPDSSAVWEPVVDRLADRFRCITPDLPGFGRSIPARDADYSLAGQARFVADLLDALDLTEPVALVGHDVGGFYACAFAAEHEARLRRVALLNTVFSRDFRWHFWGRVWRTRGLGEIAMAATTYPLFARELRRGSPGLPATYARTAYAHVTPHMKRAVLALYRTMNPEAFAGWDDRLRAVTARVPTRVLWGERDPFIPPRFADTLGGAVHRFPDAGHWVQVEKPAEVAELLAEHLAG